jgi:hypothetical protein
LAGWQDPGHDLQRLVNSQLHHIGSIDMPVCTNMVRQIFRNWRISLWQNGVNRVQALARFLLKTSRWIFLIVAGIAGFFIS